MYGQRISGIFGYTHLTGAYDGGQAEFVRVPIADVNCLKVSNVLSDEQVLFLSDIVCTGWHGCEMADVSQVCIRRVYNHESILTIMKGTNSCSLGMWSSWSMRHDVVQIQRYFGGGLPRILKVNGDRIGVRDLIAIDHCPYRIETAKKLFNARTINFDHSDVVQTLKQVSLTNVTLQVFLLTCCTSALP